MSDIRVILDFLSRLHKNNTREWFEANKEEYRISHAAFVEFVGLLIDKISGFAEDVVALEPKKCVFRIYRDVRFHIIKSISALTSARLGEKAPIPAITCIFNRMNALSREGCTILMPIYWHVSGRK